MVVWFSFLFHQSKKLFFSWPVRNKFSNLMRKWNNRRNIFNKWKGQRSSKVSPLFCGNECSFSKLSLYKARQELLISWKRIARSVYTAAMKFAFLLHFSSALLYCALVNFRVNNNLICTWIYCYYLLYYYSYYCYYLLWIQHFSMDYFQNNLSE